MLNPIVTNIEAARSLILNREGRNLADARNDAFDQLNSVPPDPAETIFQSPTESVSQ
jgi:hypothetical protein